MKTVVDINLLKVALEENKTKNSAILNKINLQDISYVEHTEQNAETMNVPNSLSYNEENKPLAFNLGTLLKEVKGGISVVNAGTIKRTKIGGFISKNSNDETIGTYLYGINEVLDGLISGGGTFKNKIALEEQSDGSYSLVKHIKVQSITVDGSETFTNWGGNVFAKSYGSAYAAITNYPSFAAYGTICDGTTFTPGNPYVTDNTIGMDASGNLQIKSTSNFTSSDQFATYFSSHPLTIVYVLKDEKTEVLKTGISKYEALKIVQNGTIEIINEDSDYSKPNVTMLYAVNISDEECATTNPVNYKGKSFSTFNKVICIGDSTTSGVFNYTGNAVQITKYSYPTQLTKLSNVPNTNLGVGGYSAKDWIDNNENTDVSGHDIAIIRFGINDTVKGEIAGDVMKDALQSIVNKLKAANNHIKIFISSVSRAYSGDTTYYDNADLVSKTVAESNADCYYLDLKQYSVIAPNTPYVNGHLTAIGYQKEAQEFYNYISYIIDNNLDDFKFIQFIGTSYSYN